MTKQIIAGILLLGSLAFGQNMDSRQGDSLALVAIKKANLGSVIDTLTGANAWVDGNPIDKWKGVTLESTGRIETLNISMSLITKLPSEIALLTQLTSVEVWDNAITQLPPEIGHLTNLITFNIKFNKLTELPKEIKFLTNLSTLKLNHNRLAILPPEIGNLVNLTTLELWANLLTTFPPEIGKLTNLTELGAPENVISTLPTEIEKCTKLSILSLWGNKLISLPRELGNCSNLKWLDVSRNQLWQLPSELKQLTNITTLIINSNFLSDVNLTSDLISWLDLKVPNWRTTQKAPSPILPQTTTKTIPLTAIVSGNSLRFTGTVPAGTSVSICDLKGRRVVAGLVKEESFEFPNLARGVYVVEILAASVSVVQKISVE